MEKLEQFALLIGFIAVIVLAVIGIHYVCTIVPLSVAYPLGVALGSFVLFGVVRVIRKSL